MPIVRIDIEAGKSTAYKRAILHGVRTAVTTALGVPDDRVIQRIVETPGEDIDAPEVRSDRLTIIEVSMLPGRDAALKGELFAEVVRRLGMEPGIHSHDIVVIVHDPPAECFYVNGRHQCVPATAESEQEPADSGEETS